MNTIRTRVNKAYAKIVKWHKTLCLTWKEKP